MTDNDHRSQRHRVLASTLLADTPEDRHGVYQRRLSAIPGGPLSPEQLGRSISGIGILVTAVSTNPELDDAARRRELDRLLAHLRGQTDALELELHRRAAAC